MGAVTIALTILVAALSPRDRAVVPEMTRADSALASFALLSRTPVDDRLDLLVVLGSPAKWPLRPAETPWWNSQRKLGLFLQDRGNPDKIYTLAIEAGRFDDCAIRIERASPTNLVVSCLGEKSTRYPHQSFLFDPRAKALVKRYEYEPFTVHRVFPSGTGAILIATDMKTPVAIRYNAAADPMFTLLNEDAARPWLEKAGVQSGRLLSYLPPQPQSVPFGAAFELKGQEDGAFLLFERTKDEEIEYPLPQSSYEEFASARPVHVTHGYTKEHTQIAEMFGPRQVENGLLWFGKTFSDGEGYTGVGAFGYFDSAAREYRMFSPPEVVDWSISAIVVEPSVVWLGLVQNDEWGPLPGGVLRWNRDTESARQIPFPDIVLEMAVVGDHIVAATSGSIATIREDAVKRYLVHRASDGRLQVVEAALENAD